VSRRSRRGANERLWLGGWEGRPSKRQQGQRLTCSRKSTADVGLSCRPAWWAWAISRGRMPVLLSWISERAQIFRGSERLEHDLRIGSLDHRFGDRVAPVALMRVVAPKLFKDLDNLRSLALGENGELERELRRRGAARSAPSRRRRARTSRPKTLAAETGMGLAPSV
jgi:hypothetical protein